MNQQLPKEFALPIIQRPTDDSLKLWISGRTRDSDTRIRDLSNYGNSGQIMGATWVNSSLNHSVLNLDGIDDYIEIANNVNLKTVSAVGLTAWIKVSTDQQGGIIINDNVTERGYLLHLNNSSGIRMQVPASTGNFLDATASYSDGKWHYVVGTYDGLSLRLFFDGVQIGSKASTGNITVTTIPIRIGSRDRATDDLIFNGSIDDIQIYNRVLSAEEIMNHYESTKHLFGY